MPPPQEFFAEWWKRNASSPLGGITLADVAKVAFHSPDRIIDSIPTAPFPFAQVTQYAVHHERSPPVINNPDGSSIITLLLVPTSDITLNDVAGLGSMQVSSLSAVLLTSAQSLTLEATMNQRFSPTFSITFEHKYPLELYLREIGYEKTEVPSITAVVSSITGPDDAFSFLRGLPTRLFTEASFVAWKTDVVNSDIVFNPSPLGIDVKNAALVAVPPVTAPSLEIGGYTFSIAGVTIRLTRIQKLSGTFQLFLSLHSILKFSSGTKQLHFYGTFSGHPGPISLEFVVSSGSSISDIFECLGLRPVEISLPFGGPSPDLKVKFTTIGFRLIQTSSGSTSSFRLHSIFFNLQIGSWAPWQQALPSKIHPTKPADVSLAVTVATSPTAIGFQLDYPITVTQQHANLLLRASFEVANTGGSDGDTSSVASVRIHQDESTSLPSPSIDVILEKVTDSTWRNVTDAIPVLGEITRAISVTDVYLEVAYTSGKSPSVTAFSISAKVQNLSLLAKPSIVVDDADLTFSYGGSRWAAEIKTTLLFANKFKCAAELSLPTQTSSGYFRFDNLDESFTFGELANSIDPAIDLTEVPVVGSTLATVALSHLALGVERVSDTWKVAHFEVEIAWGSQDIGHLRTASNHLMISWTKLSPTTEPSSSTTDTSTWGVQWDGQLSSSYRLSAELRFVKASGESTNRLCLAGMILNTAGRPQASGLVNMLMRQNLEEDSSSTWRDTLPTNVNSSFHLTRCNLNAEVGDSSFYSIAAECKWGAAGQGAAALLIETTKSSMSERSFTFAIGIKRFRFSDVYDDSHLAKAIDDHLAIVNVYVLIFRCSKAAKLSTITDRLSEVGAAAMLSYENDITSLSGYISQAEVTAGFAVLAELDINKAAPGSLSDNLGIIMNSKSSPSDVRLFCYISKTAASKSVVFTASITSIQLAPSVTIKDVELSYEPVADLKDPNVYHTVFKLQAACDFRVSDTQQWSLKGASTITKTDANFVFSIQSEKISHLGSLKIDDISLRIGYTFSSTIESEDGSDDAPNQGTVTHGNRSGKYTLALAAKVSFGKVIATFSLLFIKAVPRVITINVPNTLNIGVLVRCILEEDIVETIFDISFSKLLLYFVWGDTPVTIKEAGQSETKTSVEKTYSPGFHAVAVADVYGIKFILSVDVRTSEPDKGVTVTGTKKTPFEVICITLHGQENSTEGPSLSLSTSGSSKGCSLAGGITLFGSAIGSAKLTYQASKRRFLAAITVKASIFPRGSADIEFELVQKDGKNHFRFVNFPSVFDNLVTEEKLIKAIKGLTSFDRCGQLDLLFDELIKSSVTANVALTDPQPPKSGGTKVAFDVTGHFTLSIGDHTIDKVDFKPLTFAIEIPHSLDAFGKSLLKFLEDSIEVIVKGLVDNADKFAEVLGLVAVKKLATTILSRILCRTRNNSPGESEGEPEDSEDGGGNDGSGQPSPGENAVGGGLGILGKILGGIFAGILGLGFLAGLFGDPGKDPPRPPNRVPKPAEPTPNDPFSKLFLKDFDRWNKSSILAEALDTAVACALDYRDAVAMLRRILTSKEAVSKLPKKDFEDWSTRRAYLIYRFSLLTFEFADKWLRPPSLIVQVEDEKIILIWTNQSVLGCVTIVSVLIDDKVIIEPTYSSTGILSVDRPPSTAPQEMTAMATTFVYRTQGDPLYTFYSQGVIDKVSKPLPPNVSLEPPLSSQGGVVAFPIQDGMELTSPWVYVPNIDGPVITAEKDGLNIYRSPTTVDGQSTMLSIQMPMPVEAGLILQFEICFSVVQPRTEVKLSLPNGLTLRYDGSTFNYFSWSPSAGLRLIGKSSIAVNQQFTTVVLAFSRFAVAIFENGSFVQDWRVPVTPTIHPVFDWHILSAGSRLEAQLKNILLIPSTYFSKSQTPWDVDFSNGQTYPDDIWSVPEQPHFSVTNSEDGYMRVATPSLTDSNQWIYPTLTQSLAEPTGLVIYRMRVNVSTGSESKITVIGGYILRITNNGNMVLWTVYDPQGHFVTLASSSMVVGSGKWTNVQIVYSPESISLLEDGVYKYTRTHTRRSSPWTAIWYIQHLDTHSAISVDLSNVRVIPLAMASPPPGTYYLRNFKYQQSRMDITNSTLEFGLPPKQVMGYPPKRLPRSQQWQLSREPEVQGYTLKNLAANSYVSSKSPLTLSSDSERFVIEPERQLGVWSIRTAGNRESVVTLSSGEPRAKVTLEQKSEDDMKWILLRV